MWVEDLAGQLECDNQPIAALGMEVIDTSGPMDPAKDPDEARRFALMSYGTLPVSGYEPTEVIGHWARQRYLVAGRPKVIMVSTDRFGEAADVGWEVVGIRACDESEFRQEDISSEGLTIWLDGDDRPVRVTAVSSRAGSAHCGWETIVFLRYHGEQYLRDPQHILAKQSVVSFDADARLPDDALGTELHAGAWHLYTIPSGRAVFMSTERGTIERWPRTREEIGCA